MFTSDWAELAERARAKNTLGRTNLKSTIVVVVVVVSGRLPSWMTWKAAPCPIFWTVDLIFSLIVGVFGCLRDMRFPSSPSPSKVLFSTAHWTEQGTTATLLGGFVQPIDFLTKLSLRTVSCDLPMFSPISVLLIPHVYLVYIARWSTDVLHVKSMQC